MHISYNNYPSLLFLSYNKDNAPEELPFQVASLQVQEYLSKCKGYKEMFSYIAVKNTLEEKNTTTNYLLSDELFSKTDSNDEFRNQEFKNFFLNYVKPKHGTILFKNEGHYVYLLLGKHETKEIKKKEGRYVAVALFKSNFFIGFEEGIVHEKGIEVFKTGNYEGGMDVGGYISFCLITLAHANNKNLRVYKNEQIKETIFEL